MVENISVGQKVWFKSDWDEVNYGTVTNICDGNASGFVWANSRGYYMSAEIKDCYLTKEDLLKTLDMEHDIAIRDCCRGIQTLQDLVRFCYSRNLSKDLIAKRAAEIRAKELLEINLSE